MNQTFLLPPATAVRITWARTGSFSNDVHSQGSAKVSETALKNIRERADANETERKYIESAIATMESTYRNLDIIYKGRELNFKENETLRQAYLDNIRDNLEFGRKAGDYIKSLPTVGLLGAGSVTLMQVLKVPEAYGWAFVMASAAIGFFVTQQFVRYTRRQTQQHYITQDYERSLYYDQYVSRVASTLTSLYMDLDRIHANVFGNAYPVDADVTDIIGEILKGVRPTFCPYVHKHMKEKRIKPQHWAICETGCQAAVAKCSLWEGER